MGVCLLSYFIFLNSKNIKAKPMIIARIMAATAGRKYWSAIDTGFVWTVDVGELFSLITKFVSADVGQYDFVPSKTAYTLYSPVISGVQLSEKNPCSSLVAVPTVR